MIGDNERISRDNPQILTSEERGTPNLTTFRDIKKAGFLLTMLWMTMQKQYTDLVESNKKWFLG